MLTINIVGAGKLGKTLAYLWASTQKYRIGGIVTTDINNTKTVVNWIGQGTPCSAIKHLPPAEMTLIATPDDYITNLAQELYQHANLPSQHIIFHCSGSLNHHILKHPYRPDILTGSVHPLKSFMDPIHCPPLPHPTLCALECDEGAKDLLSELFQAIHYQVYPITSEKKALYHAGCVFASNYLVAIAHQAHNCFVESGLDINISKQFTETLLTSSLQNIHTASDITDALTGPVQRGDTTTLLKHLDVLSNTKQKVVYKQLAQTLVELTHHHPELKHTLLNILEKN